MKTPPSPDPDRMQRRRQALPAGRVAVRRLVSHAGKADRPRPQRPSCHPPSRDGGEPPITSGGRPDWQAPVATVQSAPWPWP